MLGLLQEHTVKIYDLKTQRFTRGKMKARSLLAANRFDFYAKLFYIRNRTHNPALAQKVYIEHILAFNPDGKEPGREDKNGVDDFLQVFDELIDHFEKNEFDASVSIVPLDKNNNPLDGSHRVAALAYFDKEIDVLKFPEVEAKAAFDYRYFLKRGLSIQCADEIARETIVYTPNLHIACLWPKMGKVREKQFAINYIQKEFDEFYSKSITMPLTGLSRLIYESYKHQDWVGDASNNFAGARSKALSCYASHGNVHFILFQAEDLDRVISVKEAIRAHYQLDKHALHITDDDQETKEMMQLVFTEQAKQFQDTSSQVKDKAKEYITIFKNVYWLNFKVKIASILTKLKLYR